MKVLTAMIVLAAAMTPMAGRAAELSYSYWDLSYVFADIDGLNQELDGVGVAGSLELGSGVFLFANYADLSAEISGTDVSEKNAGVGLGYAWPLTDGIDVVGRAGYAHIDAEIDDFGSIDDDGYSLGAGVRGRFADVFEVEAGVQYVDYKDLGDNTGVGVGLQWYFTPDFALTVAGSYSDDATAYSLGLRGTWGR